ncbi:MAG: hypothetical protein JWN95_2822 [Frankiales bacterium]|nr:hypothetical protein [Frankiales bacterium]
MIDSSGLGAGCGGMDWWDVPVGPLDECAPADELPPDAGGLWGAEVAGESLAVLRTPGFEPGVDWIARLARLDPTRLSLGEALDAVAAWARAAAWWDGVGQQLLAGAAAADMSEGQWSRDEVAVVLGLAPVTAGAQLAQATALTTRLPGVLAALLGGRVSALQARAIVESSYQLPDELAAALEAAVLPRAGEQSLSELKRSLRRAVLRLDPASAEHRRRTARADRQVRLSPGEDGMAQLWALLPAADAQAVHARLSDTARLLQRSDPTESRTLDQLRADTLTATILASDHNPTTHATADPTIPDPTIPGHTIPSQDDQAHHRAAHDRPAHDGTGRNGSGQDVVVRAGCGQDAAGRAAELRAADGVGRLPREQRRRPAVNVIVNLSTLLGQDNDPAELQGYGPITADYARELADDPTGTWRRLVTDPLGTLIEVGRCTYRPPAAVRDHVTTRNPVCSFPGCNHRAVACDLDHCVPWPHGRTHASNLHPLCRRHHRAKHQAGWTVKLDPDGTTHWTSPHGHHRTSRPPTRWGPDPHEPPPPNPD